MRRPPPCRFHAPPVPVVLGSKMLVPVCHRINDSCLAPIPLSFAQVVATPSHMWPCVVELEKPEAAARVFQIFSQNPRAMVLFVSGPRLRPVDLGPLPAGVVALHFPSELHELAPSIVKLRVRGWSRGLISRIDSTRELHPSLRAAIRSILSIRVPRKIMKGMRAPRWTLGAISDDVGLSSRRLVRAADVSSVNLSELAESWVSLCALMRHEVDGLSWNAVSHRLGYASSAGLSKLLRRTLGRHLSDLSGTGIEIGLEKVEASMAFGSGRTARVAVDPGGPWSEESSSG